MHASMPPQESAFLLARVSFAMRTGLLRPGLRIRPPVARVWVCLSRSGFCVLGCCCFLCPLGHTPVSWVLVCCCLLCPIAVGLLSPGFWPAVVCSCLPGSRGDRAQGALGPGSGQRSLGIALRLFGFRLALGLIRLGRFRDHCSGDPWRSEDSILRCSASSGWLPPSSHQRPIEIFQ